MDKQATMVLDMLEHYTVRHVLDVLVELGWATVVCVSDDGWGTAFQLHTDLEPMCGDSAWWEVASRCGQAIQVCREGERIL